MALTFGLNRRILAPFGRCEGAAHPCRYVALFDALREKLLMDVIDSIRKLNVWRRGAERAPHKPLLLLYAIGQYLNGHSRMLSFRKLEEPLTKLLIDFGPHRKTYHPELPFWHLYSDGFWDLKNVKLPHEKLGSTSAKKKILVDNDAHGGLSLEFYQKLQDSHIAVEVISELLSKNFPESIHEDILCAVGIDRSYLGSGRKRDPAFRDEILRAYGYSCAICGFSSRIGHKLVGVEAAHIKWHQAGGPDTHTNGIALCSLHHKLFDLGMITLTKNFRLSVSEMANGSAMFIHLVADFHGKDINIPIRPEYQPADTYVSWHVKEVFHPPGMYMKSA